MAPETSTSGVRSLALGAADRGAVGGLRTYLSEDVGRGYWDFIGVCPGVFLSVTDARYWKPHRMVVSAESLVKIRVVCAGSLSMDRETGRVSGGTALMHRMGGRARFEFLIDPGKPSLRMAVLHILPAVLQGLGLTEDVVPEDMWPLCAPEEAGDSTILLDASARLIRMAQEMLDSRHRLLGEMRQTYLRGKAYEMLCETVLQAEPAADSRIGGNRFQQRDRILLAEARRILAGSLVSPPTIDQLSRLVGVSKTKLTAGFREFFGETVKECQTRMRLAEALRLIEETDLSMGEVGRKVGFSHPANFTQFIRRHAGVRPMQLRKARATCRGVEPAERLGG